ncbi:DUF58 domain-containing protein [Sphingomonas baiyangensis]|uniref:DUF58 domain-containing protein n=1 Tax=Sphingomonas baiyangensis TaxID=2572576 RepID=A0A4U1L848_9SPHN|nr:DUF58 domain-containing protein [Sphingomonas baiyangensis]TKD53131.1 DUF58 domain-containing protein [Sphingomonas baiyangensis]
MILPTQRAVVLAAIAAPVALAMGVAVPGGWMAAICWIAAVLALVAVDAALARPIAGGVTLAAPAMVPVGADIYLKARLDDGGKARFALDVGPPLEPNGSRWRAGRRGLARIGGIWARRAGPLGFAWRQRRFASDAEVRVVPDLRPVREQGMRQYLASAQFGQRMRIESGEGQEFQSLTEYQPGMQRRAIDWKASARHLDLLAREYRTERDNPIVLAIDAGRTMCDPVDGVPRVDRAVSAALLAAFVALKAGDRARLFAFDDRPRVDSGGLSGARSFARLHRDAAAIDYGRGEANYTLALTELDRRLDRRSLVILFTEFGDPTAAELLIAAGQRLLRRHRLLFVLFHDTELERFVDTRPERAEDVTRAGVAHMLLRERRIVIERIRRLGIDVLEADPQAMPLALVEAYLRARERS